MNSKLVIYSDKLTVWRVDRSDWSGYSCFAVCFCISWFVCFVKFILLPKWAWEKSFILGA